MNLPLLSRWQSGENRFHVSRPGIPILGDLCFSTKLILLVVVPLAITLAVTLPLTVTGLNRLASVIATERLSEEVAIIEQQFQHFEEELNAEADDIAQNPNFLAAVRGGDRSVTVSSLVATRAHLGMQHVQVVDADGAVIVDLQQHNEIFNQSEIRDLQQLGLAGFKSAGLVHASSGWLLTVVRPLDDSSGIIGAVTVGKLIDSEALAQLNFSRPDPMLMVFDEGGNVVASSWFSPDDPKLIPITPDDKMVAMATGGQVSLGTAEFLETEHRTAYSPVVFGDNTQGIFGVALTTSPIVALRDQLIANHILVAAALVILVLGVGYVVTRTITRRILRLRDGAVEIGKGNLSVRVEENATDEMGILAHEFNRMADSLLEKNFQLELANRNLEIRVFERTEELEQTNAQLLEAQSQLVRTEKMAVIGELSGGVAHDLRNPLGAIRNGVFYLKKRLDKAGILTTDTRVAESLEIMDDCITKCDNIIGDLLFFTRISPPTYSTVNLRGVLESSVGAIGTPDGMTVVKELGDEEVELQADHDQLVRVFSNLALNAQDAMPDGGVLTIGVEKGGESAVVTFTDTGTGMGPEELDKVFDPLYTTKIKGNGLGLAVCPSRSLPSTTANWMSTAKSALEQRSP